MLPGDPASPASIPKTLGFLASSAFEQVREQIKQDRNQVSKEGRAPVPDGVSGTPDLSVRWPWAAPDLSGPLGFCKTGSIILLSLGLQFAHSRASLGSFSSCPVTGLLAMLLQGPALSRTCSPLGLATRIVPIYTVWLDSHSGTWRRGSRLSHHPQ